MMATRKADPKERLYWRHWWCLTGKILAGLLGLAAVIWACLVIDLTYVQWLPFLSLVPVGWLAGQIVWWRSRYLRFDNNRLVFHRWPLDVGHYINYNFVDWQFDQRNLWDKLWNRGSLRVGQHTFKDFWPYRQLVDALRVSPTPGVAPAQPTPRPAAPLIVPSQPVFIFVPIRERLVEPKSILLEESPAAPHQLMPPQNSDGYTYDDVPFEAEYSSYAGLLATCEEFLFPSGRLDLEACVSQDPWRRYYPQGMSREAALFYRELLRRARIIDDQGQLFSRIRNIEDIRQRVPYFEVPQDLAF
jgi:hypothetical protein